MLLLLAILNLAHCNCDAMTKELFMTTPEILQNRNIPHETHEVTTEDGYILSVFRLLKEERKGVVLLQHCLGLDSSIYFLSEKRSIAMEIYQDGFELWLPNFRGRSSSDKHTAPNIRPLDYWNFSFHEIGLYDLPAIINHVANTTGDKLIVINHSLSGTASLIYASLKPLEAESRVKVFVSMATSAFMNHTQSPLRHFIGLQKSLMKPVMKALNLGSIHHDFMSLEVLSKKLALEMLPRDLFRALVQLSIDVFMGRSTMGIDEEEFPLLVSLSQKPFATKTIYHYGQLIESGRFCMYDYGRDGNLAKYNSTEPPDYPLQAIKVPILLVYSNADILSDAWGANTLYQALPEVAKIYGKMEIEQLNHADYVVGRNRFEYFARIIQFINSLIVK